MRFIRFLFIFSLIASCQKAEVKHDIADLVPEYNMLTTFSQKISPALKLGLISYGINNSVPQGMRPMKKTHDFSVSYYCYRDQEDEVSIEEARRLVISIAEGLRVAIDADERFNDRLYIRPFLPSFLKIHVHFVDSAKNDLKQGVTSIFLYRGKISYDGEKVGEYNICYHGSPEKIKEVAPLVISKNQELRRETYEEALEFVQSHGGLIAL